MVIIFTCGVYPSVRHNKQKQKTALKHNILQQKVRYNTKMRYGGSLNSPDLFNKIQYVQVFYHLVYITI